MQEAGSNKLVALEGGTNLAVPQCIADAGAAAGFAWDEYFSGKLRNAHTRAAYLHAVRRFLAWTEKQQIELARITPGIVGRYFDGLQLSIPSKKLHLSAIRSFFDVLVIRHAIVLNPAQSVRTERYSVMGEGKTPEITVVQSRKLLASIELKSIVDLRDRAVIATLIYTAARAGAVAKLRTGDLITDGSQFSLRFAEKGGKARSIPVRHDLQVCLQEYMFASGLENETKVAALFRTAAGGRGRLTSKPMSGVDVCRMVKRRLAVAKLPASISPHSFRAMVATDLLLQQHISLEEVQYLLGHSDSRVTKLYDRRQKKVTRNIVERISV